MAKTIKLEKCTDPDTMFNLIYVLCFYFERIPLIIIYSPDDHIALISFECVIRSVVTTLKVKINLLQAGIS